MVAVSVMLAIIGVYMLCGLLTVIFHAVMERIGLQIFRLHAEDIFSMFWCWPLALIVDICALLALPFKGLPRLYNWIAGRS